MFLDNEPPVSENSYGVELLDASGDLVFLSWEEFELLQRPSEAAAE